MAENEGFSPFWARLGRFVLYFLRQKAHVEIVLIIQDGTVHRVRVNQNFLPADVPKL